MVSEQEKPPARVCLLREIYLSVYVLYYRFLGGSWPEEFDADAHKAVAAISIIEFLYMLDVFSTAQVLSGYKLGLSGLVIWVFAVGLYLINRYFLNVRGTGRKFEKEFDEFSITKRILLRLTAIGISIGAAIISYYSISIYHQAFHIVLPA